MNSAEKEYAGALFSLCREDGVEQTVLTELRQIDRLLHETPQYKLLLSSPNIGREKRAELARQTFGSGFHTYTANFMCLISERGLVRGFGECVAEFERLYYEHHGISVAYVTSAVQLSDAQKEALRITLERKTSSQVELVCSTDPKLIGGMIVRVNGKIYESTVAHSLVLLQASLADSTV